MKNLSTLTILLIIIIILTAPSFVLSCKSDNSNTLNLWDAGPFTLDPAISSELASHTYIMQIFSGLVYLDNELKPKPDIAENWQRSEDGKTYIFNLRKGVTFHNGKEVTAEDFKYSWERACNPATGSETASMYLNDIVGANDVITGKTAYLSGVQVEDKYTLKVTINAPKAYFLAKMSYPTAFVVDKRNVESGKEWWRQPNGTGPFKLAEWSEGKKIVLEANMKFYREIPKIKTINFHILSGMPFDLYELGKIDIVQIDSNYIDRAKDPKGPFHKELYSFPEISLYYLGFNTQKPPFDDTNIRKAFCYAIDRDKIIKLIHKDTVIKENGIIPQVMPGYSNELAEFDFNIDKARNLIANSKYKNVNNLPPIKLTASGFRLGVYIPEDLGAIIQDLKNNLGVDITVRQLEPELFLYKLREEVDEIFVIGWIADYPDPQNFLDNLFHSGYPYNTGGYSNSEVDSLLDKANTELNEEKRINLYKQAETLILNDAACLPLWSQTNYVLVKPYVKNYRLNALGIPTLHQVLIDRSIKNQIK